MKIYDHVKTILENNSEARDSDHALRQAIYKRLGLADEWGVSWKGLKKVNPESVRRCRQKIQQNHPHLRGSERTSRARKTKQENWQNIFYESDGQGTFI